MICQDLGTSSNIQTLLFQAPYHGSLVLWCTGGQENLDQTSEVTWNTSLTPFRVRGRPTKIRPGQLLEAGQRRVRERAEALRRKQ
jgi:hypothetical protein